MDCALPALRYELHGVRMTNKLRKRAIAIAKSNGISYQAAVNHLRSLEAAHQQYNHDHEQNQTESARPVSVRVPSEGREESDNAQQEQDQQDD